MAQPIETFSDVVGRLSGATLTATANGTSLKLPANGVIYMALATETAGHAVAVTLGTTSGASDVMASVSVPAGGQLPLTALSFLQLVYPVDTNIFLSSASWGGASVTLKVWHVR